ncbi:MAG: hypothetical protein ABI175_24895 [Polyangiales bacterium]
MSPEQAATTAAIARLSAEMRDDRGAMRRRLADLDDAEARLAKSPDDTAARALLAWALHGWYTALESLLERVARQIDAEVPTGDRWHRALLAQVSVEVPGVRPPVLAGTSRRDLEELLAMRHFLRHAYGSDLDGAKLTAQAARLRAVAPSVDAALDAFDGFLGDTMREAGLRE